MIASIIRVYAHVMTTYRHQLRRCGRRGVTITRTKKDPASTYVETGSVKGEGIRLVVTDKFFDVFAKLFAVHGKFLSG